MYLCTERFAFLFCWPAEGTTCAEIITSECSIRNTEGISTNTPPWQPEQRAACECCMTRVAGEGCLLLRLYPSATLSMQG